MTSECAPICPRCQQMDAVRKVTSIVTGGISVGQYQSIAVHWQGKTGGPFATAQATGSSISLLAQRLAPPEIPKEKRNTPTESKTAIRAVLLAVLLSFIILWIIGGSPRAILDIGIGLAFFVGPLSGVAFLILTALNQSKVKAEKAQEKRLIERGRRALQKWNDLSYCFRCDGVFIPGQGRFVPIEEMRHYLYQQDK